MGAEGRNEVIICGESALRYWRTPPIMRAMTSGDLRVLQIDRIRLARFQAEAHQELALYQALEGPAGVGRPVTDGALRQVRELSCYVAPSLVPPIDVAVSCSDARRRSKLLRPCVTPDSLLEGYVVRSHSGVLICDPALTLLQLAAYLDLPRLLMVATEFCGSFSVYQAAPCQKRLLEDMCSEGKNLTVAGWRPTFARDGQLTDLWSRPPLCDADTLLELARQAAGRRGCKRLEQAARLLVPGAASPLEARTGILLGLGAEHGGMGLRGFSFNERIDLDTRGQSLAGQTACFCDLLWRGGPFGAAVDVECHSAGFHLGQAHELADADRSLALQSMGIEVLHVTYAQLASERRFAALAEVVAGSLGRDLPEPTPELLRRRASLRRTVLGDWESAAYRD